MSYTERENGLDKMAKDLFGDCLFEDNFEEVEVESELEPELTSFDSYTDEES